MSDTNKRIANSLPRDLYVLEDESNPRGSSVSTIWPGTVLDQVYDNLSPTNKTLRQILEELKVEILTGGRGNIVFPVTSVNGKVDDVVLKKEDVGLGRVDNTSDIDKPLSIPQRTAIEEILSTYDFNINLDDFYSHLLDTNNPHAVSVEDLNTDEKLADFVKALIGLHNFSRQSTVHPDIRSSLTRLWTLASETHNIVEHKIAKVLEDLDVHMEDPFAHDKLFSKKEDLTNKMTSFGTVENADHDKYPSTRAVVEFTKQQLDAFRKSLPAVKNWIDDIIVIDNRDSLPAPTSRYDRKAYFIRKGFSSHSEVAVCRMNPDGKTYAWDISPMGPYSKFNPDHFVDTVDGLSINMASVILAILNKDGVLENTLHEVMSEYYTKGEIDDFQFLKQLHMLPGTVDGTIRFYINNDLTTVSDDVKVAGLQRLAYLEWITENELQDQSVHSRHILSKSIQRRHFAEDIVWSPDKVTCKYGYLLGNTMNPTNGEAHEISLMHLADQLRPLIGGWPDPNSPTGSNPWNDVLDSRVISVHNMKVGELIPMTDHSYAIRFKGEVSIIPNMDQKTILSTELTCGQYRLVEAGGAWQYQTDPEEWTILGGSNITGHTFATVNLTEDGLQFESISIGDRKNAQFDIWVRLVKPDELKHLEKGDY